MKSKTQRYFICGFSGAGKTTLLRQLKQLHQLDQFQLLDLDQLIFDTYGSDFESLGEFIEVHGWEEFRAIELKELTRLSKQEDIIVALGGGSLNDSTMPVLASDWIGFWLNTPFSICWQRIKADQNRPLVKRGEKELLAIYQQRRPLFERFYEIADASQVIEKIKIV